MKFRPASSFMTIDEAMKHVREVKTKAELMAFLRDEWLATEATDENVTIEPYGYDKRIGWDTHLLCIDGKAALFTDGPVPPDDSGNVPLDMRTVPADVEQVDTQSMGNTSDVDVKRL
jgi:hypothetical protein